jgi:hypothetical protein
LICYDFGPGLVDGPCDDFVIKETGEVVPADPFIDDEVREFWMKNMDNWPRPMNKSLWAGKNEELAYWKNRHLLSNTRNA